MPFYSLQSPTPHRGDSAGVPAPERWTELQLVDKDIKHSEIKKKSLVWCSEVSRLPLHVIVDLLLIALLHLPNSILNTFMLITIVSCYLAQDAPSTWINVETAVKSLGSNID